MVSVHLRISAEKIQFSFKSVKIMGHVTWRKKSIGYIIAGEIKSPQKRCLRVKLYQAARTAEEVQTLRECAAIFFKKAKGKT